jgi:hypothetical protein
LLRRLIRYLSDSIHLSQLDLIISAFFNTEIVSCGAHLLIKSEVFDGDVALFLPDTLVCEKSSSILIYGLACVRRGSTSHCRPVIPFVDQRITNCVIANRHLFPDDVFYNTISSLWRLHEPHPLLHSFVVGIFKLDLL